MTFAILILLGTVVGIGDFVWRSRWGGEDPKRPLRRLVGEACFMGLSSCLIGAALNEVVQHRPSIQLPSVFSFGLRKVEPNDTRKVLGRFVQVHPQACDAPFHPNEVTCELSLEPRASRRFVEVELNCEDIQITDDRGGEYTPERVVLGSRGSGPVGSVSATLVQGVRTRLEFTFRDLQENATRLPQVVLPIRYNDGRTERLTISFTEISG